MDFDINKGPRPPSSEPDKKAKPEEGFFMDLVADERGKKDIARVDEADAPEEQGPLQEQGDMTPADDDAGGGPDFAVQAGDPVEAPSAPEEAVTAPVPGANFGFELDSDEAPMAAEHVVEWDAVPDVSEESPDTGLSLDEDGLGDLTEPVQPIAETEGEADSLEGVAAPDPVAPEQDAHSEVVSEPEADAEEAVEMQMPDAAVDVAPLTPAPVLASAQEEDNRRRIGDELVERGIITKDQLNVALQQKKISGEMLGEILVELGFVDQSLLLTFLAEESGVGVFDSKNVSYDPDALALYDKRVARKLNALPVSIDGDDYFFAMSDPQDVVALDSVRRYLPRGARLRPLLASPAELSDAIDSAYGYASSIKGILKELEEGEAVEDLTTLDEKDMFSHPIVRLVNALVFDAVKMGVSDLHFEPEENFVRLRYRLDGVLFTAQTLHKQHWNGIAQRLKIMSQMDIADKINAQDGRFNLEVAGREADFRVSSLPTVHGENIVLRVLDKSASIMPMEALGFSDENRDKINRVQAKPEGIIIVTGPTGSGKTTSLYSMLNEINDVEVNIQTLEDPVEYSLPMIRQTHVREGVLEFADGIKALLRQDPDIIFIGEIRDKTTAEMALKAAMTGHQVYTSLHTNDSFGAIPRLLDLGMKPGMLAGAIVAVFAQRLARRLCGDCKKPFEPTADELALLGFKDGDELPEMFVANPEGCPKCAHGYKGRVALVEILMFDNDMNDLVARAAPVSDMRKLAEGKDFKSMADDGILKIKEGLTDIAAVSKVVDLTKGQ